MRDFWGFTLCFIGILIISGLVLGPGGIFAIILLGVGWFLLS